jgi:deoxyribodipyrimidine photolyase-like uncharacterized protein
MYETYGDRVGFMFVYIREAHPDDEWQMEDNRLEKVVFDQPTTLDQRREIAHTCSTTLKLTMPCVVDDIENSVDNAYAAWPERLFVVDADGNIAFVSGPGPWGFQPDQVREWLAQEAGLAR